MNDFLDKFFGNNSTNDPEVQFVGEPDSSSDKVKLSGRATGRVQGVGFRNATKLLADNYNIGGFVRNENDGSVYFEAIGHQDNMENFINEVKNGPNPYATIDKLVIEYDSNIKDSQNFTIDN